MVNIIVKHYLNKKLKPHFINGEIKYPLYIRVTFGRKNSRISSQWLAFPISDNEFENDKRIKKIIDYENQIIKEILTNGKNPESANLISRLRYSTEPVSECFLGWTLIEKEVKEQIIRFINIKTELNEKVITPFVKLDYINSIGWVEMCEKGVFNDETKQILHNICSLLMHS